MMRWRIPRTLSTIIILVVLSLSIAYAQDDTPKRMFASEPLKVYLTGEEPVDLIYEAAGGQTISVFATSLDSNEEDLDSKLEIFNEDGDRLAENDDRETLDLNPAVEDLELPSAGLYTIRLSTFQRSAAGGVEVELITSEPDIPTINLGGDDECEDVSLVYGDTLTGDVVDDRPTELTFCGTEGDVVTITAIATNPESTDQDLYLSLLDSDGNELITDDDSAARFEFDPQIQSFELPYTGIYTVQVSSIDSLSGEFTLMVEEA
jgi:hypothetical protein